MFYHDASLFHQKVKGSYGRYTHSGRSDRPKTKENDKFWKRALSLKNSSPDSKADPSEKLVLGIWQLISSRYDIVLVRYDIILIIYYMKGYIKKVLNEHFIKVYYIELPIRMRGFPGEVRVFWSLLSA